MHCIDLCFVCLERLKTTVLCVAQYGGSYFLSFKHVALYCIYDVCILTITYLSQISLFTTSWHSSSKLLFIYLLIFPDVHGQDKYAKHKRLK